MEHKTLIGRSGFLFLINDSSNEIDLHKNGSKRCSDDIVMKYSKVKNKYCMLVYPNKSFVCQKYLPDEYKPLIYRDQYNQFKEALDEHLYDGLEHMKENGEKYFYKTDTHMNLLGTYMLISKFINYINDKFLLNLRIPTIEIGFKLCEGGILILGKGIGDLTFAQNLGNQILETNEDNYYYMISDEFKDFYVSQNVNKDDQIRFKTVVNGTLVDNNESLDGSLIAWPIISTQIIYKKNLPSNGKRILIFYDSFTLNLIPLLLSISDEVYMVKEIFNQRLVDIVNPDFILELRVERFL